jgi:UDP-glucose 4-epimerase
LALSSQFQQKGYFVTILADMQKEQLSSTKMLNAFRDCRVLVTGATGFVGSHLCEALSDVGADVYALSRSADSYPFPKAVHAQSTDLRSRSSTMRSIKKIKPDVVYHLAGLVNTQQKMNLVIPTFKNNLLGSVHLFMALAETGCTRLVVAGSSEEPDVSRLGGSPNSPYATAKDAETNYARMFHRVFSLPVVISRPFMSYGPFQPTRKIIPYTIACVLRGDAPKISSGKRVCDLIYIQDLIMGLLLIGFQPGIEGELIDLGSGIGTTIREAVNLVVELMGNPVEPEFGAMADRLYEYPQIANLEKTADLLGYRPNWSLREGLKLTIEWYRSHPEFHREL